MQKKSQPKYHNNIGKLLYCGKRRDEANAVIPISVF